MRVLHCVEIDERVGRKAGRYRQRFGRSYGVGLPDALIAAAAHVHGLILCTRNLRHFPMRDLRKRRV
jgi:predicted nucleic acid-binding protein